MTPQPLLSVTGLTKRYGSVKVLDEVSLNIRPGEIHALLGANGAGKSTLCRIIAGLTDPSDGSMTLGGKPYAPAGKSIAEALGVQIVQQELNQIPTLSVAENILLTRMPRRFGILRRGELSRRARAALDRFGLQDIATDAVMGTIGLGRQQMIEIAAALDRPCRLLILDEPTAALSGGESLRLFERLNQLQQHGIGIIYISHRLDEVARLCDRVTVLRDGRHVGTHDTRSLSTDGMIDLMAGQIAGGQQLFQRHAREPVAMRVDCIAGGMVRDVSFAVRRGERLGIAGLVGSGRTELLRLIFGADRSASGTVEIGDSSATVFHHPAQAVAAGLAMVTEDRKQNGLLLSQSITLNTTLCSLGKQFATAGVLRRGRERAACESMVHRLAIKCNDVAQPVGTLSGGNQQKVAVSKWLVAGAEVYFFDEPTRGIDVSARRRIYQLFDALAADGKAIVIVSSDLEELVETCDRIGVMSAGRWMGDFERNAWDRDEIMRLAFAGYQGAAA